MNVARLLAQPGAAVSGCGTYRWALSRRWAPGPHTTFVLLNPSTADATTDDPTIRRCVGFARRFGCGGLLVVNLYAVRATDPSVAFAHPDPVGPDNDAWLAAAFASATGPVVAGWGAHGRPDRVAAVTAIAAAAATPLHALTVTRTGQPGHPLRLRADAPLTVWPGPR